MSTSETIRPQVLSNQNESIVTTHRVLAEILVRHHDIHEGIWGLFIRFGMGAANVNLGAPDQPAEMAKQNVNPAAIIPVLEIGLQRFAEESSISVDAAKVNPKAEQAKTTVRNPRSRK